MLHSFVPYRSLSVVLSEAPSPWTVTTPEGLTLTRKDVQTAIRRWTSTCTYQRVAFLLGVGSEAVAEYLSDERHIPKHVGMEVARRFRRIGGARHTKKLSHGAIQYRTTYSRLSNSNGTCRNRPTD